MNIKLRMLLLSMAAFCMLALSGCGTDPLGVAGVTGLTGGACVSTATGNCTQQNNATDCNNWAANGVGNFYSGSTCASLGL